MVAGDLLRLAWEAEHDGRSRLRDALMTLAIAESRPEDAWVEPCRARLLSERPDHYFGKFPSIGQALGHPRVIEARDRLRVRYPPARIQSLLLRARAARGPYLGRAESLEAMIEDLSGPPAEVENLRCDAAQTSRGPLLRSQAPRAIARSLAYPPMSGGREASNDPSLPGAPSGRDRPAIDPPNEDFSVYYRTVLLAIAFLLATVQEPADGRRSRD